MGSYYEAGITAFDCADVYTGVEEMIGLFRADFLQRHGADSLRQLKIHTKFVPDLSLVATVDRQQVERIIDRSLARLQTERLDLVQFHWWDLRRFVMFSRRSMGNLIETGNGGLWPTACTRRLRR